MKIIHTLLSLVATILIGGCGRLNSPVILSVEGEGQPGAEQYTVRLEDLTARLAELDEAGASAQKFLEERGASACWEILQQLANSPQQDLVFDLGLLEQRGVANEVMAAVIQYLACHYPTKVNSLSINGSSDNHLTTLDPAIGKLTNLTGLELGYNQLTALPTAIGKLTNLTGLELHNNQLTEIPETIGELTKLTKLYLYDNQLTALPTEMGKLTNLTGLSLHNNQLQALPPAMGGLTKLTSLDLADNQLTEIPETIGGLTKLTSLDLANNQLTALPTEMGKLTNLTTLWLANNQLTEIPETIGQLTNLKWLSLYNNQLTALPTEMGKLTNLQELNLANNQLTCLSDSLYPWLQQGRIITSNNPWLKPAELSMITREKLEKIAATQLDALHDTIRGMAEAAMRAEKLRVNLVEVGDKVKVTLQNRDFHRLTVFTLLPHLLRQGQLNRDRSIVFFEGAIPFYVERQLCSQQDVNNMLQDLEGKQLYRCLHGSPRSSSKEQPERKRRRYS